MNPSREDAKEQYDQALHDAVHVMGLHPRAGKKSSLYKAARTNPVFEIQALNIVLEMLAPTYDRLAIKKGSNRAVHMHEVASIDV